ncbi:efflux transporter outer membrane subunit [Rhodoblastus acidophilus]|uniref:Efflux transporter outer membrane subunit n=1 Tax=Candidatus Rhodoblastus alkanivorans TaxID=2954117 RepID=A0ABS9ZBG1_9HYPH|nr:efflux transporter outer membrane subunit [Candidatus Rhodoblastus alkanivorans]MCI4679390.1 efflux transporter outer membrane subunit [Candidatus Rhodoblastus alkanivorans]MCI4684866.1 efflux transporter outer membrane subunit [Candidatus Rhodoblastus alkanivorans]MDI4642190.1 efflux transporter outer membrane subunit [Rhodoblastus acidophilus]
MKLGFSPSLALRVGICAGVFALAGCDLAPPYARPKFAAPQKFKDSAPPGRRAALTEDWWRTFRNHELDRLEALIELDNPDYAAALARYQRAKAFLDLANSAFFPTVIGMPELSYNKQSQHRPLRSLDQPNYFGANQLFGQLSWEIDLWGRVHDLVTAAKVGAQANDDLLAAARLSLHASLARTYIALRGADAQAALLARTIKVYQSALDLTQERLNENIAPPIDVERAKVQLANAKAAAAEIAQGRAVLENALAAIAGQNASLFKIPPSAVQPATPRPPRAAPASLLLRRPDVAARERLLYATSERIGAAKADFLPRFYILLSGGTQSTNLDLLNFHNSLWSYGPALSAPIFDGGERQAALDAARADFSAAAADYKGSVLAAYQEVENALASIKWLGIESASLSTAAKAAQRALDMSMSLYKDGAASSLDVVTSQSAALQAERADLAAKTRLLEQYVELMLALGGGWSGQAPPPQPPQVPNIAVLGWRGQDPSAQGKPAITAEAGGH